MSKDKPKSLGELIVGEVYPYYMLHKISTQSYGCSGLVFIDDAIVVISKITGLAEREITAIYDRRKEG